MIRSLVFAPLLLAGFLALVAPASAQAPQPADAADDRSAALDEVVVVAKANGPAMWRARKGDSEVIVLGSIQPLPHQPPWDTRRLERQLDGAREVLLPPNGSVSALQTASIALTASRLKLGRGAKLPDVLPHDLRARYLETLGLYGLDPRRYESWKPGAAGFLMLSDYREKIGLSTAKPGSTVERLAKTARVPVRRIGAGSMYALFNGAKTLSDADQQRCLGMALDEIDREADFARPTAAAWAQGDLETVRRSYLAPTLEACLVQMKSYRAVVERGVTEAAAELNAALTKPGKTVAVIDLNFLLRGNGLLDQLKSAGAEITAPRDP